MTNGPQVTINKGQPYPFDPSGLAFEVDRYVAEMQKYSPRSANDSGLNGIWGQNFWTMGKMLTEAIEKQTDAITWKGVNQWIQSQKAWKSGMLPPINFTPTCKSGSPTYVFPAKWDGKAVVEGDWKAYGGYQSLPLDVKNAVVPGAGDCYLTAIGGRQAVTRSPWPSAPAAGLRLVWPYMTVRQEFEVRRHM